MRVLLVSANTLTAPYPVYPLGLDYVAGAISAKHPVKIADVNDFDDFNDLRAVIRDFKPDVIGLSLRNVDNTDTTDSRGFVGIYKNLIEVIRKSCEAPLVLGGSGFTIFSISSIGKSSNNITGISLNLSFFLFLSTKYIQFQIRYLKGS